MFLERGAASRVTLSNARASPLETAGAPTEVFARPTVVPEGDAQHEKIKRFITYMPFEPLVISKTPRGFLLPERVAGDTWMQT